MRTFTVLQTIPPEAAVAGDPLPDALPVARGTAAQCVTLLLDRMSLIELHALKVYGLHAAQKRVMRRAVAEAEAAIQAEFARTGVLRIAHPDLPALPDVIVGPAGPERDEDGDEVLEATPLVPQEP